MPGINFYEFLILIVLAVVLLGPERLPQYAQTLAGWVKKARLMADDAKVRFKEETGTDFDQVDWQRYDPRRYDPRRIVREALAEDYDEVRSTVGQVRRSVDPRDIFNGSAARASHATAAGVAGAATGAGGASAGDSGSEAALGGSSTGEHTVFADEDPLDTLAAPFDTEAT